jgi:hypothetical protein
VEVQAKLNTGASADRPTWYGTGSNDVGGRLVAVRSFQTVDLFANVGGKVVVGERAIHDTRLRNTYTGAMGLSWRSLYRSWWDAGLSYESGNKVNVEADFLQAYGRVRVPLNPRFEAVLLLARGLSPAAPSLLTHIGLGYRPAIRSHRRLNSN